MKFFVAAFAIFFLVRVFLWINYPKDYSDVRQDYERYANMWWYGLPPYFKHLYEYPPATIPLVITPLAVDLAGLGRYYFNYRFQIFLIEAVAYFFILKALNKIYSSSLAKYLAVIFYNAAPIIAKGFWWEGIDLAFISSLTLALISLILIVKQSLKSKILFWTLFWLSVGIKFVTLPLFVPFFLIKKKNFKEELKALTAGFLIIWGVPLAIFRSSLSVFLLFHAKRPLHFSAFPAFIVYTLNHFTHTDEMVRLEWFGRLSQKALTWSFIALGITCGLSLIWGILKFINNKKADQYALMLKISLVYLFCFIVCGKIFSPPFNIWYVFLLTIFPFKDKKQQLFFYFLGIWLLIFNTTNIVKLPETIMLGPFTWQYLRHLFRFPPFFIMIYLLVKNGNLSPQRGKLPRRLA